jgi:putative flippase GtrA
MIQKFLALKGKYLDPSMVRWGTVGLATFIIDYSIFITLFHFTSSVLVPNLLSMSIATSFNYYTHHRWTFKSEQNHAKSGLKYLVNLIFWWLVSTSIIKSLLILDVDAKVAKLAPLALVIPINYFVLNKIVFKKKS